MTGEPFLKRFLPRSLMGRAVMIIVMPLILLQLVSGTIFYESHWDKVSRRLARSLAGDVGYMISLMRLYPGAENRERIFRLAARHMHIDAHFETDAILPNAQPQAGNLMQRVLINAMKSYVGKPFQIDTESMEDYVRVQVQLAGGVLDIVTTRKRLFSTTTYVFVLWMIGTSLILFGVAAIFMRNQVKPIRRLAQAADAFGKGRDVSNFKPEGAKEVRQAATAFIAMQERIQRQISQRTEMLAGVSHDLRTPLTRMKLQLAMLDNDAAAADLQADVTDMERMLESYLAFARGEGAEVPVPTNLSALLQEVADQARRKGGAVDLHSEGELEAMLRPQAFKRCLTNLVENATRYADHVSLRAGLRRDHIEITIDDDGPGIPEEKREEVFKPFFRLEASRNPGTGGMGLGLAIARDVIRGHGGDIDLADSPFGGLRAKVKLPL